MVKAPQRPPDWRRELAKAGKKTASALVDPKVIRFLQKANDEYYYWEELRSRPLSVPYSKELIWACLRRNARSS